MTRILDINLIKANLGLFVKALCQRKQNDMIKPDKIYNMNHKYCEEPAWEYWKKSSPDKYQQNREKWTSAYTKTMKCRDKVYATRDPLKIIEVRDLMVKEAEKVKRERERRTRNAKRPSCLNSEDMATPGLSASPKQQQDSAKEMSPAKPCTRHMMILRSSSILQPHTILLPVEIILIIADMLEGWKEIRMLLWIFPHWRPMMPQGYWRSRFVRDLTFDYEEVPEPDAVDWRYLYYKVDQLSATSHGLRNRRRIMKILEGTKELFLKYVLDEQLANK
jgi:hypothetical protein